MAEEDLIFGKKRHLFGGIEPSNMIAFTAGSKYEGVKLVAKLPKNTVIDGQSLCTVAGAVIRRSTDEYPEDEFSGIQVANITEDCSFIDTDVEVGTTYYYSAFPYTKQGVYNRDSFNRVSITHINVLQSTYIFGYDLDTTNSDPDANVTYPTDVDNVDYEPALFDAKYSYFKYGSWPSEAGEMYMPRPCMLTYDGMVAEYLDPNDYRKTVDGADSRVADTEFNGNAMMEWPIIYTKRELVDGIYKFRCSDVKVDDDWDCICNYNINDELIDHFYTAIYNSCNIDNVNRSLSQQETTCAQTFDYVQANGDDWYIEEMCDRMLINDLLVMMFKSTDICDKTGYGYYLDSSPYSKDSGTMDDLGLFGVRTSYESSSTRNSVKIFGMEHWWGNVYRRVAGLYYIYEPETNDDGTESYYSRYLVKPTRGLRFGGTLRGYNQTGEGYERVEAARYTSSSTIRSASHMAVFPWGLLPDEIGGTTTTYYCGPVIYGSSSKTLYAVTMGYRSSYCGPFCMNFGAPHYSDGSLGGNVYYGAALSYKPSHPKEV